MSIVNLLTVAKDNVEMTRLLLSAHVLARTAQLFEYLEELEYCAQVCGVVCLLVCWFVETFKARESEWARERASERASSLIIMSDRSDMIHGTGSTHAAAVTPKLRTHRRMEGVARE